MVPPDPQKRLSSSSAKVVSGALIGLVKVSVMALVYTMPLFGAWAASSLAAYRNGPTWVPLAAAVACFPVLPVAWEALASWRRRRGKDASERILTLADRLTLRTFAVNGLFLLAVLVWFPTQLFTALSARGDWFIEGSSGPAAQTTRRVAFAVAERFEWLYDWTHDNPFAEAETEALQDDVEPQAGVLPSDVGAQREHRDASASAVDTVRTAAEEPSGQGEGPSQTQTEPPTTSSEGRRKPTSPTLASRPPTWPLSNRLHPIVGTLPPKLQTSPESVGRAIAASVADPFERVKAVHDYVADRIAYDVPSYLSRNIPSQEADTVFHARRGVCSGYAKLMVAIGTAAGIETKYIVGSSRDMGGDVSGQGHAWNAVRVGQRWFLLDATWDAGSVSGSGFNKGYRSDYLLTPPGIFGANHLPDDPAWQLRAKPISHAEFIRQPNLRPSFHAMGLRMQHPTRSQVSVEEPFVAEVENPQGRFMTASYEDKYAPFDERCTVTDGPVIRVQCDMRPGTYHVKLFANEERFGVFDYVGQFEVNRR